MNSSTIKSWKLGKLPFIGKQILSRRSLIGPWAIGKIFYYQTGKKPINLLINKNILGKKISSNHSPKFVPLYKGRKLRKKSIKWK